MSKYERLSLGVQIIGFVAVVFSIFLLHNQTRAQIDSLRSSSYAAVNGKQLDLDNIFVQHPDMRPYFFEKRPVNPNDEEYHKVVAIADYTLDYFDLFLTQAGFFLTPEIDPGDKARAIWESYILDSFKLSPILCQRLRETKNWYIEEFIDLARETCNL